MTTLTPPDPRKAMRQNLPFLRAYAKRVVLEGDDSLTPLDDVKDALVQEVRKNGKSFNLADRTVAMLTYKGVFPECY